MKILIYTVINGYAGALPDECRADYMSDLLFHGLRELLGSNCVDYPKKTHLYKGYPNCSKLWGNGFSYTETLEDISINRDGLEAKLTSDYYDVIVVAMHNSSDRYPHMFLNALHNIKNTGTKAKIAVLDGKDSQEILGDAFDITPYYFKREISDSTPYFDRLIPISFAIPECKIVNKVPEKTKALASIVPADHSHPNRKTHVYKAEEDYYRDYQNAYFALTCKKAGWDCMRHYEIMANGCIPIFTDIENCPKKTLTTLPKGLLSQFKSVLEGMNLPEITFDKNNIDPDFQYVIMDKINTVKYNMRAQFILEYTKRYLTTKQLAKDFMEILYD